MKFETHIKAQQDNETVVDLLVSECPLSRSELKSVMQKGAVWATSNRGTRRVRRASSKLNKGDEVHLYYDATVLAQTQEAPILIADEGDYSIWYKPQGMLCQGSRWGDHCTINRWVETHDELQRPAFIVHRLDRAASGLILLAHKKRTAAYFSKLFQKREIDKHYKALVQGEFPETLVLDTDIDGKPALSRAGLIEYRSDKDQSLVEVRIETGRKHQIRRHLSEAGFPIVGDHLHGRDNQNGNLRLTACYLAFEFFEQGRQVYELPDRLVSE